MLELKSSITHDGSLSNSTDYTHKSVNLVIDDWTDTVPDTFDITGINIQMQNTANAQGDTNFTINGRAAGLQVDIENVFLQTSGEPGYKYAAIFDGDIGIGRYPTPDPLSAAILDVDGIVFCRFVYYFETINNYNH